MRRVAQKKTSGRAKTKPTPRARIRCAHSHQKIRLNALSSMPLLICWYSGICWYLSNSSCHSASFSGGITPWIGFHSVIDRPDSVSRVAPPTSNQRHQHQENDIEPAAHQRPVAQLPGALAANRIGIQGLGKCCQFGVSNRAEWWTIAAALSRQTHATRRRAGFSKALQHCAGRRKGLCG